MPLKSYKNEIVIHAIPGSAQLGFGALKNQPNQKNGKAVVLSAPPPLLSWEYEELVNCSLNLRTMKGG